MNCRNCNSSDTIKKGLQSKKQRFYCKDWTYNKIRANNYEIMLIHFGYTLLTQIPKHFWFSREESLVDFPLPCKLWTPIDLKSSFLCYFSFYKNKT